MSKKKGPAIGFLSAANYYDRNAWSGTICYIHKALKQSGQNIVDLGNPTKIRRLDRFSRNVTRSLFKPSPSPKPGSPEYKERYKKFADLVTMQLKQRPCDILFAPVGSAELTFFETSLPVIYLTDVTFKLFIDNYHPDFTPEESDFLEFQEKTAIKKAASIILPSEWAARSVVEEYKANPALIEIVPFGANLEEVPDAGIVIKRRLTTPLRLLWVGRDWKRKGGKIAVETLVALKQKGISATLTIIGCVPPDTFPLEDIKIIPNIDKNKLEERQILQSYFKDSHFFIFPTRADCSPIVLCEASAYALPVLASDVGGISNIIETGKNGYLLPLEATGENYASIVVESISDPSRYAALVKSSRKVYDLKLNWTSWAERFRSVVKVTLEDCKLGSSGLDK